MHNKSTNPWGRERERERIAKYEVLNCKKKSLPWTVTFECMCPTLPTSYMMHIMANQHTHWKLRDEMAMEKKHAKQGKELNKTWFFKPKSGSVFPTKRRLVKRMVFYQIVQYFGSLLSGPSPSATSPRVTSETHKAKASIQTKNSNKVLHNWSP